MAPRTGRPCHPYRHCCESMSRTPIRDSLSTRDSGPQTRHSSESWNPEGRGEATTPHDKGERVCESIPSGRPRSTLPPAEKPKIAKQNPAASPRRSPAPLRKKGSFCKTKSGRAIPAESHAPVKKVVFAKQIHNPQSQIHNPVPALGET